MKKLIFIITVIAGIFLVNVKGAKATHAGGGEIIYVYVGDTVNVDSTYQFFFKFYRDCSGVDAPNTVQMCFYNDCTNTTYTRLMTKYQGKLPPDSRDNGSSVSAGCSEYKNKCDSPGSTLPGYREWWYTCTETLPLKCDSWHFSVTVNARNTSQNIMAPTNTPISFNLYVETVFDPTVSWVNSSPFYSIKPVPYVCINKPFLYNNAARDADGDSLWTNLMRPLTAQSCSDPTNQVGLRTVLPPINFNMTNGNPFQTNNSFNLDGNTGQMGFTATQLGAHTLTVRTNEYRQGQQIGSIMRDVQVQVIACNTPAPNIDTPIFIGGGTLANGNIAGCIDQPLNFCFDVVSPDTQAILLVDDNLANSNLNGATMTYTNLKTDSVRFCFSWTPTAADAGQVKTFQVTVVDSTCKPPGILLTYIRDISIYVWPKTDAGPDTSICFGEPVFLSATGGINNNFDWTVLTGNDPTMPQTNIAPTGQPTTTTTYQVAGTENKYCSNSNKDTVTITVVEGPELNPRQSDINTCADVKVQLNAGIVKNPNATYDILWTPATGLSNNTIENPTVQIKNDRTYYLSVGSDINRCRTLDTINVNILDGLNIDNPDTSICIGESVKVRGTGDALYTYAWIPDPDDNGAGFTNTSDINTEITPADTGTYTYIVKGSYAGCPDTTASILITIEPIPNVTVNDDDELCFGDTMKLDALVNPSTYDKYEYIWSPGASLDYPDRKRPIYTANQEGVTKLTLTVRTAEAKCSDSDDVNLTVFAAEFLKLPADTAICAGDTLMIALNADGDPRFYWAPDFNISSISALQPRVWPVTNQRFTVFGKDSTGCLDTNSIFITVRPRAVVELPDTVRLYRGESYRMDPGGNALYYSWFPPLGLSDVQTSNPLVQPEVNTRYIVHARTEGGCEVVDSIDILISDDSYIVLPNAFTPKSRTNNVLKIIRRGDVQLKRYAIYNRWGNMVFETTDINEGWDGTFNGEQQPVGVYVYTIEAVSHNGEAIRKQGNVTLLK